MASPFDSPQTPTCEAPGRGVVWVLSAAAAAVVIAAWFVLLAHLVLVVRAEFGLAQVVREANAFAELPQVTQRELLGYTGRQLQARGFQKASIRLAPQQSRTQPRMINSIKAQPGGPAMGATQRIVAVLLDEADMVQHSRSQNGRGFLYRDK